MTKHELKVERQDQAGRDAVVYRLTGVLGETKSCFDFLEEVRANLPTLPRRILLEVRGLELVTSPGIGVLAACFNSAKKVGKALGLVGLPMQLRKTLEICHLDDVLPTYGTVEEALAAL